MIAEQEDVVGFLHAIPEPHCGSPDVVHVIAEIIEVIAKEHRAVSALRGQPMVSVVGAMVQVGNDQRAHRLNRL
jgi:hypothetical protein